VMIVYSKSLLFICIVNHFCLYSSLQLVGTQRTVVIKNSLGNV